MTDEERRAYRANCEAISATAGRPIIEWLSDHCVIVDGPDPMENHPFRHMSDEELLALVEEHRRVGRDSHPPEDRRQ